MAACLVLTSAKKLIRCNQEPRQLFIGLFSTQRPSNKKTPQGAGESRKRPWEVSPIPQERREQPQVEQVWSTDQTSSQEVIRPKKRQRLTSSRLNEPHPLSSTLTPPPPGIATTRPPHLPPVGLTLDDKFNIMNVPETTIVGRLRCFLINWLKLCNKWIQDPTEKPSSFISTSTIEMVDTGDTTSRGRTQQASSQGVFSSSRSRHSRLLLSPFPRRTGNIG